MGSLDIFIENIHRLAIHYRLNTYKEIADFLDVSEDALKSYFRECNYKIPPLKKLDEMAEALGKPTYKLIKEERLDEEKNTREYKSKVE